LLFLIDFSQKTPFAVRHAVSPLIKYLKPGTQASDVFPDEDIWKIVY